MTSRIVNQSSAAAIGVSDPRYWAAVMILLPLVLQRLFLGGLTGDYATYEGFALVWVGYAIHLGFILVYLIWGVADKGRASPVAAIAFTALTLPQVFVTANMFELSVISLLFPYMRALVWVFAVAIYATHYFESEKFVAAFIDTMRVAALFILACFFVYQVFGIPIGINIEDSTPRVHGTFSEPSTLACVMPAYVIVCYMRRRYWSFALGLVAIYLAASAIVTGVMIFLTVAFAIQRTRLLSSLLLYVSVGIAVLLTLSLDAEFAQILEGWSIWTSALLDSTIGPSTFRALTIDRFLQTISMLADYSVASTILDLRESSGLARYLATATMVQNMRVDGTTWFGYGFSTYAFVATKLYGTLLDFGFFPYLLGSFGILIGTMLTFVVGHKVVLWWRADRLLYFVFMGGFVGTLYNSGGGILPIRFLCLP